MRRTIDHALFYQFCPHWPQHADLHAQGIGNIAGMRRTGPQIGHRSEKVFFTWSQPVKADPKKVCIKLGRQNKKDIVDRGRRFAAGVRRILTLR